MAQVSASDLVYAVFNMAGADWPEDIALLQAAMEERGLGRTILVHNDALSALYAGTRDGIGVAVVCGTGAATGARADNGRVWHSSNWQDQVQGGRHLGLKTLDALYRAELGIEPPTSLTPRILDFFHVSSIEEVLHLFTSRVPRPLEQVKYLAPLLLDEAQAGDTVALNIVREHGRALGQYAHAAARRVGLENTPFALVLAGGVFRHPSTILPDTIIDWVRSTSPEIRPTRCRFEPVVGALLEALEAADQPTSDAMLARLEASLPPSSLFMTATAYVEPFMP